MQAAGLARSDMATDGEGTKGGLALATGSVVVPGLLNKALTTSSGLGPRRLVAKIARSLQDPVDMR